MKTSNIFSILLIQTFTKNLVKKIKRVRTALLKRFNEVSTYTLYSDAYQQLTF